MAATLLERPTEPADPNEAEAPSVVVSGPDGAEYDISVPAGASPAEVAAIAASVSAALSAEAEVDGGSTAPTPVDDWNWCGRLAATGCRRPPVGSTRDTWKLSGRPGLF